MSQCRNDTLPDALQPLERERTVVVAYLTAICCIHLADRQPGVKSKTDRETNRSQIKASLTTLDENLKKMSDEDFVKFAREQSMYYVEKYHLPHYGEMITQLFSDLITSPQLHSTQCIALLDEQLFCAPESKSLNTLLMRWMVTSLAKCDAAISLKMFLEKLDAPYREKLLTTFTPLLCRSALVYQKTNALRILFDFGLLTATLNAEQKVKAAKLLGVNAELLLPPADDAEMNNGLSFKRN